MMEMSRLLFICGFSTVFADSLIPGKMISFMKRYGYLTDTKLDINALDFDVIHNIDIAKDVIRLIQKFGGLPETGIMDEKTLSLIEKPRCSLPDVFLEKRKLSNTINSYVIFEEWKKKTISFFVANWPGNLGPEVTEEIFKSAFDVWSAVVPFRFVHKSNMSADIIISFVTGAHGDGFLFNDTKREIAHAYYPNENIDIGHIHINANENWIDASKEIQNNYGIDLFAVAVHELGHSLGLKHSNAPGSIMNPYYKKYDPNFKLHEDDIIGMYNLYNVSGIFSQSKETRKTPFFKPISKSKTVVKRSVIQNNESMKKPSNISELILKNSTENSNGSKNCMKLRIRMCPRSFDAITLFRNELFIFKGTQMWRSHRRGIFPDIYPVPFNRLLYFPSYIKKIDAVYERRWDSHLIAFTGKNFWEFGSSYPTENSPRPISYFGLSNDIDGIDAVFTTTDGLTYFFIEEMYWLYDEMLKAMSPGYPRSIQDWKGLPSDLDSALIWRDGQQYFFKGKYYWKLDNETYEVEDGFPRLTNPDWLIC